ncbi:MAG: GntR family transcriptional regulator [Spirochaetota bacterium]
MSRIESTIVADEVYRRVKLLIIEGRIPQGARIDRKILAADLGVSLTPVNEATARLLGERFLERRSGASREAEGLFVPERPTEEMVHVFAVRAGLEGIAARLCVERGRSGVDPQGFESICAAFDEYEGRELSIPFDAEETEHYLAVDRRFHEAMIEFAQNPILDDLDRNLGCIHRSYVKGLIRRPEATLPEHREILKAFRARDPEAAQNLIIRHHLTTRDYLQASLGKA